MRKLSSEQIAKLEKLKEELRELEDNLQDRQSLLETAADGYNQAADEYNDAVLYVKNFIECNVISDMEVYYEERTDKWQESEAGQRYKEWIDTWQSAVDGELCDANEIEIDLDFPENVEVLDNLPAYLADI